MRDNIIAEVYKNKSDFVNLFRTIHNNPEIAFEEKIAATLITELLESHGFDITKNCGGLDTAFKANFKGSKPGPRVAFIAEYDALPKIGHGCGHNIIATCSVAAAISLSKCMDSIEGEIVVMGTPAEEGGGGKIILIEEGEFNNIDYALMIHPTSNRSIIGRGGLAAVRVTVEFFGKSAHSSSPDEGINALTAIINVFNGIDVLRPTFDIKTNINGIIMEGGRAANVITDYSKAAFSVRATTLEELKHTVQEIKKVVRACETLTGAKAIIDVGRMYAERYPNLAMGEAFKSNMGYLGVEMGYPDPNKRVGSSDIGNVTLKLPAIHSYLKIAEEDVNAHSEDFTRASISDRAKEMTLKGAAGLAMTGYDILTDKGLRNDIKKEFEEKVRGVASK